MNNLAIMQRKSRQPVFSALLLSLALAGASATAAATEVANLQRLAAPQFAEPVPTIQMAILLDTSSSMDGLIDQARQQLWQAVDEFSKAKRNGVTPRLQVAVYEYGNQGLSAQNGYTRKVVGFTPDLDRVSEALFSLTTNGGDEFCGYAINAAVNDLQWSRSQNDIKAIFISGNEPFTQGPVNFRDIAGKANNLGITVNTIHAGSYEAGIRDGWQQGALLASGNYMSIDHNVKVAHIVAPQDQKIAELNAQLNQAYIPYGAAGRASKERQNEQDKLNEGVSIGLLAKRVKSKVSSLYDSSGWDLVDAIEKDAESLESIDDAALPKAMQAMNLSEKKAYVEQMANKREQFRDQIQRLSGEREKYVAEQSSESEEAQAATLNTALMSTIRKQGEDLDYEFASE